MEVYKSGVHQKSLLTIMGPVPDKPYKKLKTIVEPTSDEDDEFKDAFSDEEDIKEDIKK